MPRNYTFVNLSCIWKIGKITGVRLRLNCRRLYDNIMPISLREMFCIGGTICTSTTDWKIDGFERGLEMEYIEKFLFYLQ